jgi:nicotinic acid mononucleotide adenylyltransferase
MLLSSLDSHSRLSAATSEGGLFLEIARECRTAYGDQTKLSFLCGRDAAERIIGWDYGTPCAIERMLEQFELIVADRQGAYVPPVHLERRVRGIRLAGDFDMVSASAVRDRIREGLPWEDLVPPAIVPLVRDIYSAPA